MWKNYTCTKLNLTKKKNLVSLLLIPLVNNNMTWKSVTWWQWPHWLLTLGDKSIILRPFSTDLLVLLISLGSVVLEVKYLLVWALIHGKILWVCWLTQSRKLGVYKFIFYCRCGFGVFGFFFFKVVGKTRDFGKLKKSVYCRFLILRMYIILRFNLLAPNRENIK